MTHQVPRTVVKTRRNTRLTSAGFRAACTGASNSETTSCSKVSTSPSFCKNSSILGPRIAEYIPSMSRSSVSAIVLLMLSHEAVLIISFWTLTMCAFLSTFALRSTMNELGIGAPCVVGNAAPAERFVLVPEPMEPGVYVNNSAKNRGYT
jgi:hypothetical protein